MSKPWWNRLGAAFLTYSGIFMALSGQVLAPSDEIQVYDGSLALPGVFNLT